MTGSEGLKGVGWSIKEKKKSEGSKNPSFWRDDLDTQMPSGRGSTSTALRTNKDDFKLLILELTSFELHVDFQPSL